MSVQPTSVKLARWAVLAMFFTNGAVLANWLSRIPQIQANLSLSEGQLGLVLMGIAAGVLTALTLAGGLIARFGSRTVTAVAGILLCLLLLPLALMPNAVALWVNLFLYGAVMSLMDVAMNSQGVDVERALGRSVMSSFHAAFSIGGFVGAATGATMAFLHIGPALHFGLSAALFILLIVLTAPRLMPIAPDAAQLGVAPIAHKHHARGQRRRLHQSQVEALSFGI